MGLLSGADVLCEECVVETESSYHIEATLSARVFRYARAIELRSFRRQK